MAYADVPHLRSNQFSELNAAAPTVATVTAGAGTGSTVTKSGRDEYGQVAVTAAGTPAAGAAVTVTFATPFNIAPVPVVSANDGATAALGVYASATKTALTIGFHTAPTAASTYTVNYAVIGG